ncbi:MAG: hypothetical protein MJ065_07000 [Oscillospiraceae bacterium]|nr:hypothetical protein [Oscillospiraceae bacterium]
MIRVNKLKITACILAMTALLCGCQKNTDSTQTAESSGAASSAAESGSEADSDVSAADGSSADKAESKSDSKSDSQNAENSGGSDASGDSGNAEGSEKDTTENRWTADHPYEIGSKATIAVEPFTVKAGDKNVPVNVKIWNNPGFTSGGIQVYPDSALSPVVGEIEELVDKPKVKIKLGTTMDGFMYSALYGEEDNVVGIGFAGGDHQSLDNGILFTFYIDVPADAKSGTKYEIRCNVDALSGNDRKNAKVTVPVSVITVE